MDVDGYRGNRKLSKVGPMAEEAAWPITMLFVRTREGLEQAKRREHWRTWSGNSCIGICCVPERV